MSRIWTVALLILGGCAQVGGDYHRESLKQTPTAWSVTLPKGDLAGFWPGFGDPQMVALIERALADSHSLEEAAARVREARALAVIAGSNARPKVEANASVKSDRASDNGRFPLNGLSNPVTLYQAGFDAGWEWDLFGGLRREREAAQAEVDAAGFHHDALAVSLAAEVANTYFDLRAAQAQQLTLQRQMQVAREALGLVQTRVRAGLNPDIDALRAEDELARIESRLPTAEAGAGVAIRRLGILLGGGTPLAELSPIKPLPEAMPGVPETLPAALIDRRPDLAAAEAELRVAMARIGSAEAAKLPQVSLLGSLGLLSMHGGNLFTAGSSQWNLGPQISLPLLNGGALDAGVEAARARRDASAAHWRQLATEAIGEVESTALRLREADQRQIALAKGLVAQREIVELARVRYERGLTDLTLPLDAVRQLLAAETDEIDARARRLKETVALYKVLGGGWNLPPAMQSR